MRGEIWFADLSPRSGSEQMGVRPVIVLSHDSFNTKSNWKSLIVVPMSTSTAQSRRSPTSILLQAGTAGLQKEGYALCHHVTTLDRSKLQTRVGVLTGQPLADVEQGLKNALDLS